MTRAARRYALLLGLWLAQALAATGQGAALPEPAVLVADNVVLDGGERLIASGHVEALYDGRRLTARQIVYDRATDQLILTGPITLHEGDDVLVLADSGALDRDFRNGILRGARIVMGDHVQLAANEMNRAGGRYSQLTKVTVTSCRICDNGRPPLWQIRASSVIHDQQAQQLYFQDAQFRIFNTPVFYLPRLRLPDPTLTRATGFLVPSLYNSSLLGTGARVPYFIRIGDHKDITITPFITGKTRTLEARYRQAFRSGRIEIEGAISDDDINPKDRRGFVFAVGEFALPQDFVLRFDVEAVTDDTYLLDYSYSGKDRLDSEIEVERARRDEYVRVALTHFHTLRVGEENSTLPTIVANGEYERRIEGGSLPGEFRLGLVSHGHFRSSSLTTDGPDFDPWADGRDVARLGASLDWHRSLTLGPGILTHLQTGVAVDTFQISQTGVTSASSATELSPSASAVFRWPFVAHTARGTAHVVEPVLQAAWIGGENPNIPNDESTRIEFDEGNLFATSRFTAPDRRERGLTAAYGIMWTRYAPSGWQTAFAVGQVVRDEIPTEASGVSTFSASSGLNSEYSDALLAAQVRTPRGLIFTARGLFDSAQNTTKAEARASWNSEIASVGATYIWLGQDLAEARPNTISEWAVDASYRIARHWTAGANWRYDVARDNSVQAGFGVTYTNECVDISLSASRRFTSSTILSPSTDISLTVGLRGFSAKTYDKSYDRTCRN